MKQSKEKKPPPKRFNAEDLKPLSDEDRKRLFPHGPVTLKQLRERKQQSFHNDNQE